MQKQRVRQIMFTRLEHYATRPFGAETARRDAARLARDRASETVCPNRRRKVRLHVASARIHVRGTAPSGTAPAPTNDGRLRCALRGSASRG